MSNPMSVTFEELGLGMQESASLLYETLRPKTRWLPEKPERTDLLPYLRGRLKSKRLRKKFLKNPDRYHRFVIGAVWTEYSAKRWWRMGEAAAEYIRETMGRVGFARQIFQVSDGHRD